MNRREFNKEATENMRTQRMKHLENKLGRSSFKKIGQSTLDNNKFEELNLGIRSRDMKPVKLDILDIEPATNMYSSVNTRKGEKIDISSIEHNPNKIIKKKFPSTTTNIK
jgi:hypothetical protein